MYKILSWACYYAGDLASKIMCLFGNTEWWSSVWYPIYNTFMIWSGDLQDKGGFDPQKVEDTTGWPWRKPTKEDEEKWSN